MDTVTQLDSPNALAEPGVAVDLLAELVPLAEGAPSWLDFCRSIIRMLIAKTGAEGGLVWTLATPGYLSVEHVEGVELNSFLRDDAARQAHQGLADYVARRGTSFTIPPRAPLSGEAAAANPTNYFLLFGIIRSDIEPYAILELVLPEGIPPGRVNPAMLALRQVCEFAAQWYLRHTQRDTQSRQDLWLKIESFVYAVHRGLDSRSIAYTLANDGRRLIECDRLSIAVWNGRKCRLAAISGQDTFDKRSNQVRLLSKLATAVVKNGEPLWFSGDASNLPPQIETAVDDYLTEAHSKFIAVLPLDSSLAPTNHLDLRPPEPKICGAAIVELIDALPEPGLAERAHVVAQHGAVSLANAVEHESLFLMPMWRTIGKSRWLVQARTLPKTLLAVAAAVIAIAALFLIQTDFDIESKGTLEPVAKRDVFAPQDGVVKEVLVEHGQMVADGAPLLTMTNTETNVTLTDLKGKLASTHEQLKGIDSQRAQLHLTVEERERLSSQAAQLHATRRSLEAQVKLLADKQAQLQVISPLAGQVATWQLRDKLINRPVQRGQQLLTVADPSSDWQLELHLPEERMGYIGQAQRKMAKGESLSVRYISSTNPSASRQGTVQEIHTTAEPRADEGNTILVKVRINKDDLAEGELHPGAGVTAKIHCGRASLGYCWFHDVINFFHRLWFKL